MILSDSNGGPWIYDGRHHAEYRDRYLDLLRVRRAATTREIADAFGCRHFAPRIWRCGASRNGDPGRPYQSRPTSSAT